LQDGGAAGIFLIGGNGTGVWHGKDSN